jgi:hypothetical protein
MGASKWAPAPAEAAHGGRGRGRGCCRGRSAIVHTALAPEAVGPLAPTAHPSAMPTNESGDSVGNTLATASSSQVQDVQGQVPVGDAAPSSTSTQEASSTDEYVSQRCYIFANTNQYSLRPEFKDEASDLPLGTVIEPVDNSSVIIDDQPHESAVGEPPAQPEQVQEQGPVQQAVRF